LFEQSVKVGTGPASGNGGLSRVTFGSSYAQESLLELFIENRDVFPVLLPMRFDDPAESVHHLRLHNGTIWRWNRPIIGFGGESWDFVEGATPHLRIEHRVVSAGPSVVDCVANAALFFGLVQYLGSCEVSPESKLTFGEAANNFYTAARFGLDAKIHWLGGEIIDIKTLFKNELLCMARQGLEQMELERADIGYYLGIIEARVMTGQNGSTWQQAYVDKHHCDMRRLAAAYLEYQKSGKPVHEWPG
jgi:hypothetical protein